MYKTIYIYWIIALVVCGKCKTKFSIISRKGLINRIGGGTIPVGGYGYSSSNISLQQC